MYSWQELIKEGRLVLRLIKESLRRGMQGTTWIQLRGLVVGVRSLVNQIDDKLVRIIVVSARNGFSIF